MPFARIATLVSVSLLVAVAGCGHDPEPRTVAAPAAAVTDVPLQAATEAPAVTHSPAPKATVAKKPAPKVKAKAAEAGSSAAGLARFVAVVQQKLPGVALDRRDEEVEDLGQQACAALGAGRSATAAAGEVADEGVTPADARKLVGLARADLCRT